MASADESTTGGGRLPGFYTTREVAELAGVSPRAVRDWASRGLLVSARTLGGHHRYPAAAVHEMLVAQGLRAPDELDGPGTGGTGAPPDGAAPAAGA